LRKQSLSLFEKRIGRVIARNPFDKLRVNSGDEAISRGLKNKGKDCFAALAMTLYPNFPNSLLNL